MQATCDSVRRARPLLGTFVEIAVAPTAQADREAAIEAAFGAVAAVHRLMSFHDPESDVSRLNREAFRQPVTVGSWTYRVLEAAMDLHRRSGGLFDVTIAPALQRIGLLPGQPHARLSDRITAPTSQHIDLLPGERVRFRHPRVRIDLGGIAKGYAVDCAIDVLLDRGIPSALVNAGGDLAAFGQDPYAVCIRDPRRPGCVLSEIDVFNNALASTGGRFDAFRTLEPAASAVIDPTSQQPACGILAATVRAPSCMIADALTKVVMLAGGRSASLLEHYRASALLLAHDGDVRVTADWEEAVHLAP